MKLELESGTVVDDATAEDISSRLEGEEFAILSRDDLTYLQCAAETSAPHGYILEYQDGSTERHYTATDASITLSRVQWAFVAYLSGDESWKTAFSWERLELPREA